MSCTFTIDLHAHILLPNIPQKFYNRMSVVKPSEMVHWKQLALEYMTEESDDPDDGSAIVEHKLQWRSQSK